MPDDTSEHAHVVDHSKKKGIIGQDVTLLGHLGVDREILPKDFMTNMNTHPKSGGWNLQSLPEHEQSRRRSNQIVD